MASRRYLKSKERNERSKFTMIKEDESVPDTVPPPAEGLLAADSVTVVPSPAPTPRIKAQPSVKTKAPATVVSTAKVVPGASAAQAGGAASFAPSRLGTSSSDRSHMTRQLGVEHLSLYGCPAGEQKRESPVPPRMTQETLPRFVSSRLPTAPVGQWIYSADRIMVRSGPWALTSMRPRDEGQVGNWYWLEPMDKAEGVKKF